MASELRLCVVASGWVLIILACLAGWRYVLTGDVIAAAALWTISGCAGCAVRAYAKG